MTSNTGTYTVTTWLLATVVTLFVIRGTCALQHTSLQCGRLISDAQQDYYADPTNCNVTCLTAISIQHGNGMKHKWMFIHNYLEAAQGSECPFMRKKRHVMVKRSAATDKPVCNLATDVPFRTADGSCNNLECTQWGMFNRAQNRILPNAYDDGFSTPRQSSSCVGGGKLPSARTVSNVVHRASLTLKTERRLSLMVMQWGQLLAHDMVLTPIQTSGVEEQINLQTSEIDASMVYGSSAAEQASLRLGTGGLLQEVDGMLPVDGADSSCDIPDLNPNNIWCFLAGDIRVNEQPGLASIQILLLREHNRIARALAGINPSWSDEKLFQECRKIVAAEMQLITYRDWLPLVLGIDRMAQDGLAVADSGFSDKYDTTIDPTVANVFAVAILRFGHSLIPRNIGKIDDRYTSKREYLLRNNFFKPNHIHDGGRYGAEEILRWQSAVKCPRSDRSLENSVREFLFLDESGDSVDLCAMNNQRARDHGVPSYNDFRVFCGFNRATHFGTGPGGLHDHNWYNARLLSRVYSCPDEIDVYTGCLTEKRIRGGLLGPTQACLMSEQFKRTQLGDRFWYERNATEAFTLEQLNEIRKVRLSTLMCDNTASHVIQPNVFLAPKSSRSRSCRDRHAKPTYCLQHCSSIPRMDLTKWLNAGVDIGK